MRNLALEDTGIELPQGWLIAAHTLPSLRSGVNIETTGGTIGDLTRSTYPLWRSQAPTTSGVSMASVWDSIEQAFGTAPTPLAQRVSDGL